MSDLRDMKAYLDIKAVRATPIPVGTTKYLEQLIGFWIFLPDQLFAS